MQLDGIRGKVFLDRYALKDKEGSLVEHTPEETWRRVARGIAQSEKPKDRAHWEEAFYNAMADFKFVPAGRILSGAGTGFQVTYFNCFVIPSPKDSRHGILEALGQLVEIQARSGGVGLNLSSLRPRGARVQKVNGTSSGPINWATLFSVATHDIVQQGGSRRGATMIMLWDWHPDIEEFITVKQDLTKINGANLSVCISDSFMEAVKADKEWDLIYPDIADPEYDEKWNGEIDQWKAMGKAVKVYKTVKARYLWDLICTAAWQSAEPGLHFMERSNKRSNTQYFERLVATNPSLRAGTRVLTKEGIFPIEQLEGKTVQVKNLNGEWSSAECFLSGREKQLYKIKLNNGQEIFATAEHKWPVALRGGGFGKVTTNKLQAGNILPFPKAEDIEFETENKLSRKQGFMIGWLYGDGWISERKIPSIDTNIFGQILHDASFSQNIYKTNRVRNFSPFTARESTSLLPRTSVHEPFFLRDTTSIQPKKVFGFLFSEEDKVLAAAIVEEVNKLKTFPSNLTKAHGNTYTIQSTGKEFAENLSRIFGVDKKEKGLPISVWQSGTEFVKGFIDGLISSDGFVSKNSNRIIFTTKHKQIAKDVADLLSFYGIKTNIRRSEATRVKFPNQKVYSKIYERFDLSIDGNNVINFAKIFTLSHPRKQANLSRIVNEYAVSRSLPDNELMRIVSVEETSIKEDVWDISVYDETHCFYINHCVTGNCGEQPLGAWAVCNLGAMNLSAYVKDADLPNDKAGWFDYKQFSQDVKVAMRFMDNVIEQTYYFFPENEKVAKDIRRTGLGIMGLGDALIKMKIRYGAEESIPVVEKIFQTLRDNAYEASSDIAAEKGSFPKFDKEQYMQGYHIKALPKKLREKIRDQGIRNAVLLTVAPTGTTSTVAGVSSGIEPVYEFAFKRTWRGGEDNVYHPLYDEWRKAHPDQAKAEYFVSANDLTPLEHVRVQAIAQEYIDSSISKTVNAPATHSVEDVKVLYMAAYEQGLKGITYMREGSRTGVLERIDTKKEEKTEAKPVVPVRPRVPRPSLLMGTTYKTDSPVGRTYITINNDEKGHPFEVFIHNGKSGSDVMAMADALGRMISFGLRLHSPISQRERVREIVSELTGIGGARSIGFGENRVRSLPDAVAKILAKHCDFRVNGKVEDRAVIAAVTGAPVQPGEQEEKETVLAQAGSNGIASNGHGALVTAAAQEASHQSDVLGQQLTLTAVESSSDAGHGSSTSLFDACPQCQTVSFAYEEGCKKCYSCGYSEC